VILGEQRQCPCVPGVLVEHFDGLAPGSSLGRADLAQIQDVALHHAASATRWFSTTLQ
jgi:hypothetical protein